MDTQNTPVHISLWHADFWILAIANLLITMSVYLLIPILPVWMYSDTSLSHRDVGMVMGAYGVGLFLLGGFCNWFVQRYRRREVKRMSLGYDGRGVLVAWHLDCWG